MQMEEKALCLLQRGPPIESLAEHNMQTAFLRDTPLSTIVEPRLSVNQRLRLGHSIFLTDILELKWPNWSLVLRFLAPSSDTRECGTACIHNCLSSIQMDKCLQNVFILSDFYTCSQI